MPQPWELDWTRLPLEGAHNTRELGGYPTSSGAQTRYHRFLRSDALGELTQGDVEFLRGYGVRTVIDLRDPSEVEQNPNVALGDGVTTHNVPLLAFDLSQRAEIERRFREEPPTYEFFYELMLKNRKAIGACMRAIAEAPEGCVLFHCAVGKDRTGIIALLLMAVAGCDKWDCVANYVQTRPNLMRHWWFEVQWGEPNNMQLDDSPAHAMEHAWDVVRREGGVVPFLIGCGLSNQEIAAIQARILS